MLIGIGKQMDVEDSAYRKYAIVDFHSIVWMFISNSVTIYRTLHHHRGIKVVIA